MSKSKDLIDKLLPTVRYGCYFRLVELEDAEFILSLRSNEKLSRYISETSDHLEDQIQWLEEYKLRENQGIDFYLICMSVDNKKRYGVNRIYNVTANDFEVGSWLYSEDSPKDKAILGHLFCNALAFEILELNLCKSSTRKNNKTVLRYLKTFYPKDIVEDNLDCHFTFERDSWNKRKNELLKMLGY